MKKVFLLVLFLLQGFLLAMDEQGLAPLAVFDTIDSWAQCIFQKQEFAGEVIDTNWSQYVEPVVSPEAVLQLCEHFNRQAEQELQNASQWFRVPLESFENKMYACKLTIEPQSNVFFMGDLHGSAHALVRNLLRLKSLGYIGNDWVLANKEDEHGVARQTHLVFLGDIVDRGAYGLECWCTLMKLFIANAPFNTIVIVKGNHEELSQWKKDGFVRELRHKYPAYENDEVFQCPRYAAEYPLSQHARDLAEHFEHFTNVLPSVLYLACGQNNGKPCFVQCCHGGVEPNFDPKPFIHEQESKKFTEISIQLRCLQESRCGFLWSDFTGTDFELVPFGKYVLKKRLINSEGTWDRAPLSKYFFNTKRNAGYITDIRDTKFYLEQNDLAGIFRGHQDFDYTLKLVQRGVAEPVAWHDFFDLVELSSGVPMSNFLTADNTVPVFTFSTATEGRAMIDEGFGHIVTQQEFSDWAVKAHIYNLFFIRGYDVVDASSVRKGYVHYSINNGEPVFVWQDFQQQPVSFPGEEAQDFDAVQEDAREENLVAENESSLIVPMDVDVAMLKRSADDYNQSVDDYQEETKESEADAGAKRRKKY